MKKYKQGHHMIPIFLLGIHFICRDMINGANLILLSEEDHKQVHKTLTIDSSLTREFHMKHNLDLTKDVEYYKDVYFLHKMYFKNLKHLKKEIILLHLESIKAQVVLFSELFNYNKKGLHLNAEFMDAVTAFNFYLEIYHKIFVHRARTSKK